MLKPTKYLSPVASNLGFNGDGEFAGGLPPTARLQDQWKLTPIDYAHISVTGSSPFFLRDWFDLDLEQRPKSLLSGDFVDRAVHNL